MERFFDSTDDPGGDVVLTRGGSADRAWQRRRWRFARRSTRRTSSRPGSREPRCAAVSCARASMPTRGAGQRCLAYTPSPGRRQRSRWHRRRIPREDGRRSRQRRCRWNKSAPRRRSSIRVDGSDELLNDRPPLVLRATVGAGTSCRSSHGDRESPAIADRRRSSTTDRPARSRQAPGAGGVPGGLHPGPPEPPIRARRSSRSATTTPSASTTATSTRSARSWARRTAGSGRARVAGSRSRISLTRSDLVPAAESYSYVFGGNAQTLDHVIVDRATWCRSLRVRHARRKCRLRRGPTRRCRHRRAACRITIRWWPTSTLPADQVAPVLHFGGAEPSGRRGHAPPAPR